MGTAVVLAVLAGVASWLSLSLTRSQVGVASAWITNGLIVGYWVLAPRDRWPLLGAGAMVTTALVRLALGDGWLLSVGLTAINGLEAWIVASMVRRHVFDVRDPTQLKNLAKVGIASSVLACLVTSSLAATLWALVRGSEWTAVWGTWLSAHLLGTVTAATVTMTGLRLGWKVLGSAAAGRRSDYVACVGLLITVLAGIFSQDSLPVLFLAYLPLALLTYRHGAAGVVAGTVVLAVASALAASHAWGPFDMLVGHGVEARALLWQVFVGAGCLLTYPTAIAVADRRRLLAELAASKEVLQSISDNIPAHIARLDADERYTFANAALARSIGMDLAAMLGRKVSDLRPPEVYSKLAPHIHKVLSGQEEFFEFHIDVDGKRVDYRGQLVPDRGPDGEVRGFYSIAMDVSALKQAERKLDALARTDPLTGLANRRQFEEALAASVGRAQRNGQPLMAMLVDVDRFKLINDTYGHAVGDAVIRDIANRLRECVYEVDLPARLGGDEFVVLMEYSPRVEVGQAVAERIVGSMAAPISVGDLQVEATVSIGVGVHFPVRSGEGLIEIADRALYAAKSAGRATWRLSWG